MTDSTPTVGLPFVVVAMTAAEAAELEAVPGVVEDELGGRVYEQFQKLVAGLTASGVAPFGGRYQKTREAWTPFRQGTEAVGELVARAVCALNDAYPTPFRDRRVKVQHYPFDALVRDDEVLVGVYDELAQTGCVILADELSLFHPRVARALTGSPLFGSAKVAMVTISPFDPGGLEVERALELALRQRMNPPYRRFHKDYDPDCEFGVGDTRRLLRWLHSTLPHTLSRLREVQPDARSIQAYFAQKLGRDPSGPGFASQLFRPEDAL